MEDILASIRRIIADDQSRSLATASNAYRRAASLNVTPPPLPLTRLDEAELPAVKADVPSPFAALQDGPDFAAASSTSPGDAPARDEVEVDAPVLVARSAAQPHLNPPALPPTVEDDLSVIADIVNAGAASILNQPAPIAETAMTPVMDLTPEPDKSEAEPVVLSLHGFEAQPLPDRPEEAQQAAPATEPLVSPGVGASIEHSFQALATSVFLQNTASVEAMTRDMLRPLLKTWLDDNLPTIVERLVRIEIERVARGVRS